MAHMTGCALARLLSPQSSPSRRELFAGLTALTVMAMPPSVASASPRDAIFAALERHRVALARVNAIDSLHPDWGVATTAEWAAWRDLVRTVPLTLAGLRAFAVYLASLPDLDAYNGDDRLADALRSIGAGFMQLQRES